MIKKDNKKINNSRNKKFDLLFYFVATVVFLIIVITFTWPLVQNITHSIIGQYNFTDGPFFIWNLWWVKKAILSLSNPFYSDYVYFPYKANLALHTLTFTSGLIYLPLSIFFRPLTSLNIIQILSFLGSGVGMMILVSYLTKPVTYLQKSASYISGIIFAFSPYIFSHLMAGHYNLTMLWPFPFIVYFLFRVVEEKRTSHSIILGILFTALGYLDLQLAFFAGIICIPVAVGLFITGKKKFFIKKLLLLLLPAGVFFLFFLLPYVILMREFWGHKELLGTYNNGDVSIIFGPNPLNSIFKNYNLPMVIDMIGSYRENTVSLGFTGLFLVFILFVLFPKQIVKEKIIFIFVLLLGIVLAMGPYLQVDSKVFYNIKLPFYYLQNLPLFNLGLVPPRFIVIAYFALATLAGMSLFCLVKFFESKRKAYLAVIFLVIFICSAGVEFYSGRMLIQNLEDYPILQEIIKEEGDFTILPYGSSQRDGYMQTQHNKRVVTGFLGRRIHDYYMSKYWYVYPIHQIAANYANELNLNDDGEKVRKTFDEYKIKYIVADKVQNNSDELEKLDAYLKKMNLKIKFNSDTLTIYAVY
ncbi:MAG: hypothetical protein ABH810_00895 [bacterium]